LNSLSFKGILEGRDAAGKDGTIKRIVKHLSPRETRVVALGAPSDRDKASWYFQRYRSHLPAAREFVIFNRSWYNRAGVERVIGFCTKAEHEEFLNSVADFEHMLVRSGIKILKYYIDINKHKQKKRLKAHSPMAPWKIVRGNDKHSARINIIRDILTQLHYKNKNEKIILTDPKVILPYDKSFLENGMLAQ
jgi:polyphosphate kinase 2 (PPK2 family)